MIAIPFSSILAGHIDGLVFEEFARPSGCPRPTDPSWGQKPADFDSWFLHERGPEAAGIINIEQAYVFGNEVVYVERVDGPNILDVEQNFLSFPLAAVNLTRSLDLRAAGALSVRQIDGEIVLLSGHPYNLYGHWMIDFMPRLQLLRASGRDLTKMRFLLPSDIPQFVREWLELAGIGAAQLILYDKSTELCRCERALMPTNLRQGGRALPMMAAAASWMAAISGAKTACRSRLLYVSRENWGNITRKLENFLAVESVMTEFGFEVVFPEKLGISGQAKLFSTAAVVAGDYGSGLHNTIFSDHDTRVIALRGTYLHPGFLQSGLCEVRQQPLSYVYGRTWADDTGFQHYEICLDELRSCLSKSLDNLS